MSGSLQGGVCFAKMQKSRMFVLLEFVFAFLQKYMLCKKTVKTTLKHFSSM